MSGGPGLDAKRQVFLGCLKERTKEMDPNRPYFGGKDPMLVDLQLARFVVSSSSDDSMKVSGTICSFDLDH